MYFKRPFFFPLQLELPLTSRKTARSPDFYLGTFELKLTSRVLTKIARNNFHRKSNCNTKII